MAKNQDTLKNKIYNYLKSLGYEPEMLSSSGKEVPVVEETDIFRFTFQKDGESYGTAYISIDNSNVLTIYQSDELQNSPDKSSNDPSWEDVRLQLRRMSFPLGIKSFDIRNKNHLENDMAKREYNKKLDEGYYPMGKKASYSDNIPETKMIIQHTRNIEEGEQRYRNIARIFIENMNGERFLLPTTKPGIGRVYARHIAEGGTPYDERGQHITSLAEEYSKMAGFVRATRNGQFNESAQKLVNEGVNHYQKLRETLHKLTGKKGYNTYFESYTPPLMEDESQADLSEMFMSSSLDPRIECVMPILSKLSKNISEDNMKEIKSLEEWAEGVAETFNPNSVNAQHASDVKAYHHNELKKKAEAGDKDAQKRLELIQKRREERRAEADFNMMREGNDEDDGLIAGRYTPEQWAKMIAVVKKKAQEQDAKKKMAVVKTDKPIGTRVSDIGPGGKEYNVKTDSEWDKQKGVAEGEGNFEKALNTLSGSWSGWHKDESSDPNIESYWFDDGEGGYYAGGTIEHDLQTGKVTVDYSGDEYHGPDVKGTFDNFGDAMRALRGGGGNHGGKAPKHDTLASKTLAGPDDLYKTDRAGKKGTLTKARMDGMKASSQYTMRGGPKGVLPEQGMEEGERHQRDMYRPETDRRPDTSNSLATRSIQQAEKPNVTKSADGHPTVKYSHFYKTANTRVEPTITPTTVKRKDSDRPIPSFLQKGVAEGNLNELFEPTLNYYKLSNGKTVQVSYRPNVNQSPVPFTDVSVSYVNTALKPQGPSFDSTGVAKPWTSAPDGVKQAIQKFATQPQQGVSEGKKAVKEDTGATCSSSIASVVNEFGDEAFTRKALMKRLGGYSNRLTNVKKVK